MDLILLINNQILCFMSYIISVFPAFKYLYPVIICLLLGSELSASENIKPSIENISKKSTYYKTNRKKEKALKFLNSKIGQWLIKKTIKKIERKQARVEKLKAQGKPLKQKRTKRFKFFLWGFLFFLGGVLVLSLGVLLDFIILSSELIQVGVQLMAVGVAIWIVGSIF